MKTITDMKRVWKVTKKPTQKEYWKTVKIVSIGFFIIGLTGFVVEIVNQLVIKRLFV
jgi:protein translocase SEC61 complex gamma subunit